MREKLNITNRIMVQLTCLRYGVMDTYGMRVKDPEKIIAHYSDENVNSPYSAERTFKKARLSLGRDVPMFPNLSQQNLEANRLFEEEKVRQRSLIARVEKIKVVVDTKPYSGTELLLDKNISTPFDCARHLHEFLTTRSIVAELQELDEQKFDEQTDSQENSLKLVKRKSLYWDMHRPLVEPCRIKLRHFLEEDVSEVNRIYWRSCSFVLGMAVRLAFKDMVKVLLHSWPKPNVKSGSFVYDVALNLDKEWSPTQSELMNFTKVLWTIKEASLPFEPLKVSGELAKQLFIDNPFKLDQIDSMIKTNEDGKINVYRCGGLLDMSIGPMISNTSQIGRISLAAVHNLQPKSQLGTKLFYRFQGVSLPQQLPTSSYLYQNMVIEKAKKLNTH